VNLEKSNLLEERKPNILQELKKSMKRIKFKKCTPVRVLAKLIGKLSATRTQFTQASLYLKQLSDCLNIRVNKEDWDTYVPWEYRMIGEIKWWVKTIKINKPHLISINPTFQAVVTRDASPIAWETTFQAVNQNVKINPRKEMEKLSQEEKNLAILSEKGKLYCPTSLMDTEWSYTDQLSLKPNQKFQKEYQIAQKKWSNYMKKQTLNLKELTAIYLALHHFLFLTKKSRYKNILIRMDNTAAMYNINKKSRAMNLYRTARKIWKLSERNYLILKAVHIPGRINAATDKLSRLEMSREYQLNEAIFQRIQKMWRCYPKVDLFASKKN
jgi:hypothetical protein